MKKAIKIDVEKQCCYEIELGDDYREIYQHIGNGCTLFANPVEFENNDCLYCDDEGLLQAKMIGAFIMSNWSYPIVGNAIILGTDEDGDSINYSSDIKEIEKQITWLNQTIAENYRKSISL